MQSRAVHVFTEAARVLRFRNICLGPESNELKLVTLGGLLRKSHESLREKYDCSSPELEELMVCSRRAGAFGARLTGAGWGGCSIHLMRQHQVRLMQPRWRAAAEGAPSPATLTPIASGVAAVKLKRSRVRFTSRQGKRVCCACHRATGGCHLVHSALRAGWT